MTHSSTIGRCWQNTFVLEDDEEAIAYYSQLNDKISQTTIEKNLWHKLRKSTSPREASRQRTLADKNNEIMICADEEKKVLHKYHSVVAADGSIMRKFALFQKML